MKSLEPAFVRWRARIVSYRAAGDINELGFRVAGDINELGFRVAGGGGNLIGFDDSSYVDCGGRNV